MLKGISRRPSAIVLIIANLLPLFGVIFLGWDVFSIVFLYWLENVVLGGINILKMITCRPDPGSADTASFFPKNSALGMHGEALRRLQAQRESKVEMGGGAAGKLFMIPFFTVHYFGFCAGHGVFVFALFGGQAGLSTGAGSLSQLPAVLGGGFALAALGLLASHLYSFFANYIGKGEYRRTILPVLMFKPYGRIVVLHVAIIFGGFLVMALNSPAGLLIVLIFGKILIDLKMHFWEHGFSKLEIGSPLIEALAGVDERRSGEGIGRRQS